MRFKLRDEVESELRNQRDKLLTALKMAECVYRKNVVKDGEPSNTLIAMQKVIAEIEGGRL